MYYKHYEKGDFEVAARPISLRIPDEVRETIEESCRRTGRDFSSVTNEMLSEAVKMRRIPGIAFGDGPTGRRAMVAGTGIDVWEVARDYRDMGESWEDLREAYEGLSDLQLRAALAYAEAYPEEIEERIKADERWTPEAVWTRYPFTRPAHR